MKWIAAVLVGVMLFGSTGCSDSLVGTDGESSTADFKRKKPPPVPEDPGEWPTTVTFADRTGDQIRSDAELRSDLADFSYVDGECGVWANIGNFDDARLDSDRSYKKKLARTCGEARVLVFQFDDGRPNAEVGAFMNVDGLCSMTVGEVRWTTNAQFNVCNTLVFEDVRAERTGETAWLVTADGAAADAYCSGGEGSWHNMPFEVTITANAAAPCPVDAGP